MYQQFMPAQRAVVPRHFATGRLQARAHPLCSIRLRLRADEDGHIIFSVTLCISVLGQVRATAVVLV